MPAEKKLTVRQKKICDWIALRPGYLKKSALSIYGAIDVKSVTLSDCEISLKVTRNSNKVFNSLKAINKAFKELSVSKKRIVIAEDVIKSLDNNRFIANTGRYISIPLPNDYIRFLNEPMQELLCDTEKPVECTVCAMGSLFMSKIRLGNSYYGDIDDADHAETVMSNLKGIFTEAQLRLIETAFEGKRYGISIYAYDNLISDESMKKAIEFYFKHEHIDERLRAIMNNIIKNKGTFKP